MREQYGWVRLSGALIWMQYSSPFQTTIFNHEQALKNALLSGEVPVRGKATYHSEYQRIEKFITSNTEFWITADTLRSTLMEYESVDVAQLKLEEWLNANSIEGSSSLPDRRQTPTARAEKAIGQWLSERSAYPPGRKADIYKWAKSGDLIGSLGAELGRKTFDRAWASQAPREWKEPGIKTEYLQKPEIKSPQ